MSEMAKSMSWAAAAVVLAALAFFTAPTRPTPDEFIDRGEVFFPAFTNPNDAKTLEVVEFNEETAEAVPFKVTFKGGKWTIPSHHDYPADGEDQLAKAAAGVIGIRKDDFRTDNVADHEACGVIDPLDEGATSLKGRGRRITIRGDNDQVLADLILGKKLEDRPGYRFVRLPDQKRVYVSKADLEVSSKFQDWIDKDVLDVDRYAIDRIVLRDYSIDERTYSVNQRDVVTLDKDDTVWKADHMPAGKEVDVMKMDSLLRELDTLSIVGVRPKPEGLSSSLKKVNSSGMSISQEDLLSLQSKGFYFSRDGSLLSNEGELQARSKDGVVYTLRFGEIVYGSGDDVTAGTEESDRPQTGAGENRYLFVTTSFDAGLFPEPKSPASLDYKDKKEADWTEADRGNKELDEKHQEWQGKVKKGQEQSDKLNARFAGWYYVIPAASFDKIHLTRKDLLKDKAS